MATEEKRKNTDYEEHITNENLAWLVKQTLKEALTMPFKQGEFCF